jgi:hypothetical protein
MKNFRAIGDGDGVYKLQKRCWLFWWKDVLIPSNWPLKSDTTSGAKGLAILWSKCKCYDRLLSKEPEYDFAEYIELHKDPAYEYNQPHSVDEWCGECEIGDCETCE